MKELTRIITVEITAITMTDDETKLKSKEESAETVKELIENSLGGTDNVNVVKVQDFIVDKGGESDGK